MNKIEFICKHDIKSKDLSGVLFIKDKTYKAVLNRDGDIYRFCDFERGIIDRKYIFCKFQHNVINKHFRRKNIIFGR